MPIQFKFFYIPSSDPVNATDELNAFIERHNALTVEHAFVDQGVSSAWSVCVQYHVSLPSQGAATATNASGKPKKPRIDYREVLTKVQFHVFALLRDCRAQLATREGVPTYVIATNEQLAAMVRGRVNSKTTLAAIDGIGKARTANYGEPMLAILREHHQALCNDPDDVPSTPASAGAATSTAVVKAPDVDEA
ncbi:MAG: HRDC domain-containing protein [Pseudomonadota bacterium]